MLNTCSLPNDNISFFKVKQKNYFKSMIRPKGNQRTNNFQHIFFTHDLFGHRVQI